MRVDLRNNPDVCAIRIADAVLEGPLGELVRIRALRIAQRAWIQRTFEAAIQRTSDLQASYSSRSGPTALTSRANAHAVIDLLR